MSEYFFKKHPLSEAERLWLTEAANSDHFDPKVAKVKLLGKLPGDFDHTKIDQRLYSLARLTPVGLWHLNPTAPLFQELDVIIRSMRQHIIDGPGVEQMTAVDIAKWTESPTPRVRSALFQLSRLGSFFSGSTSTTESDGLDSVTLTGDNAYDEYLRYKTIEDVLETFYVNREPSEDRTSIQSVLASIRGYESRWAGPIEQKLTKPGTAFVLMAMDKEKPEIEDVYVAIKEVCREFGIRAYRADEIEHQDRITDLILREIQTCEFLVADLSYERPNVYYEVGYAHALNKRPILFRRAATRLHFDLSVHNVPEYRNITELRDRLRLRLEAILGRKPKSTG